MQQLRGHRQLATGSRSIYNAIGFAVIVIAGQAKAAPDISVRYIPLDQRPGLLYLSISADARFAAYAWVKAGATDIAVHDLVNDTRVVANLLPNGAAPTSAQCGPPVISGDARYAVFGCNTQNMGTPILSGQSYYVYDRINNKTEVLPVTTSNAINKFSVPALSADGRYLAYRTANATETTIFVRDLLNRTTLTTSAKFAALQLTPSYMSMSGDGRYVSYVGAGAVSRTVQGALVYDVSTGTTDVINVNPAGVASNIMVARAMMSGDGKIVVFHSPDPTLVNPPAQVSAGIYVRDRRTGKTEFISAGTTIGGNTNYAVVSANGRYVAYLGQRSNVYQIYVYDRLTKVTRTIPGAFSSARQASMPTFSANGRYLAFHSFAALTNLPSIGIADLGAAAGVSLSSASLSLTEGGSEGTYTLALTQAPTADVVVKINTDQHLRLARTQLTFTSTNWSVPQVVSVQAVQDGVQEGAHTGTVTHTVTSTDIDYTVIPTATVEVAIADAIRPTIVLPASVWSRSDLPVTGRAAPRATVLLTAVNRTTGWMASASTIADQQGQWNHLLTGLTNGVVDLDAQADGIKSAVQTVTVKLEAGPF